MLRIVICDDEKVICDQLSEYITRWAEENDEETEVRSYTMASVMLADYKDDTDILLLDIMMDGMNGLDAAKELRRRGKEVRMIFITSMTGYAIECYKVRAFGFLTKPVSYEEFRLEFSDAARSILENKARYIMIRSGGDLNKINVNDILYLEVKNHIVTVYLNDGSRINCYQAMKILEGELGGYGFFRCHAAFLVNQRFITKIRQNELELRGGIIIPVSRQKRQGFLDELTAYVGMRI